MKARGVISDFYVESLAFQTGWFNCPVMARYVSHAGLPVVGYTGRFLKNWGDFGTVVSLPQMKVQLGIQLTSGIACGVGDHMHCNGQLEPAVYDVIREGFRFAKVRQPYCTGIERTREVAICAPAGVESNTAVAGNASAALDVWSTIYSAAKLCMEGHFQWDVIDPSMDLDGLDCVIQCHARVDEAWLDKISGFVERGGTLLLDAAGHHGHCGRFARRILRRAGHAVCHRPPPPHLVRVDQRIHPARTLQAHRAHRPPRQARLEPGGWK